jgi:hypothetical protein
VERPSQRLATTVGEVIASRDRQRKRPHDTDTASSPVT